MHAARPHRQMMPPMQWWSAVGLDFDGTWHGGGSSKTGEHAARPPGDQKKLKGVESIIVRAVYKLV